jgi:hypothetical protein
MSQWPRPPSCPNFGFALVAFTLIGVGENLLVGPEMRLVQ